jgi:hypothetical protein
MFAGSCHCGALRVELETRALLDDLVLRECRCSFCGRHRARTTTDPAGSVRIYTKPHHVPYRFGAHITDVYVCSACGVYVAMTCTFEGATYATVNTNTFDPRPTQEATTVSYDDESIETRLARRARTWTPARIVVSAPTATDPRAAGKDP